MARKIEISAEEAMQAVDWRMPIYNRVCSECGALCFDDDSFCAECGVNFKESVVSENSGTNRIIENKYIVPLENNDTIDIHELYDIICQETGLTQNEIFEAIYSEQGNGSKTYIDSINCEELLQSGWVDDDTRKVYRWIYDHIKSGELPDKFLFTFGGDIYVL